MKCRPAPVVRRTGEQALLREQSHRTLVTPVRSAMPLARPPLC